MVFLVFGPGEEGGAFWRCGGEERDGVGECSATWRRGPELLSCFRLPSGSGIEIDEARGVFGGGGGVGACRADISIACLISRSCRLWRGVMFVAFIKTGCEGHRLGSIPFDPPGVGGCSLGLRWFGLRLCSRAMRSAGCWVEVEIGGRSLRRNESLVASGCDDQGGPDTVYVGESDVA